MDFDKIQALLSVYGLNLIYALVIFIIGQVVIKYVLKLITRTFVKSNIVDNTLKHFLISLIKISLQVLLIVSVASMLGVKTTSFIAIIGSAGLAIGLALQGSLSNFAGGVLILILKPFKVGDYIEAAGHAGTVAEIQIFYTILNSPDNKRIVIPNGNLSNSSAINYSANPTRRVDIVFGVSYESDIKKVKGILTRIAEETENTLTDPPIQVVLLDYMDNSINFALRVWCKTEDYWQIHFDIKEKVKYEFDKEGISIPFPQVDVHMIKQ